MNRYLIRTLNIKTDVLKELRTFILILTAIFLFGLRLTAQETYSYPTSDLNFPNPERGLYGFTILTNTPSLIYENLRSDGITLAYAAIELDCCRTSMINDSLMANIQENFNRMRVAGVKGIPRIVYDGMNGQDTTLAWMEVHLQQLQPVFETNKDVIAFFQAGMIGAWGEWHTSVNGLATPAGRAAVWDLVATYVPDCIPIQVRRPAFVYELEGDFLPLSNAQAFSCSRPARLGHHNDCWLADETDQGTYADSEDRENWLTVFEYDTRFVPWGGETCLLSALSNCDTALSEATRLHAGYLNKDYNPDVIEELAPCWETIKKQLGYRLEMIDAQFPKELFRGEIFDFQMNLENSGWAPIYRERPVKLRIFSPTKPITILAEYQLNSDPRFWSPEAGTITMTGSLVAPASVQNEVSIALYLPDSHPSLEANTKFAVRFANTGVWEEENGHNVLAEGIPLSPPRGATAHLSSNDIICDGDSVPIQVALTGAPPWRLTWSDGAVQNDLMASPAIRLVTPNTTTVYSISEVTDQNGAGVTQGTATVEVRYFNLTVTPGASMAQGLRTLELKALVVCGIPLVEIEWRNMTEGTTFGIGVNPISLFPHPTMTTEFQVTVTDALRHATEIKTVLVLVPDNPLYLDLNGDDCNTIEDLWLLGQDWSTPISGDPNSDGTINILDFLYINTDDELPCNGKSQ